MRVLTGPFLGTGLTVGGAIVTTLLGFVLWGFIFFLLEVVSS